MSVVNFQELLRARVSQMADEQMAMQEALMNVPPSGLRAYLAQMEEHAIVLSQMAARLEDESVGAKNLSPLRVQSDPEVA